MNTNELVKWINELIEANELWKFYKGIEFRHNNNTYRNKLRDLLEVIK